MMPEFCQFRDRANFHETCFLEKVSVNHKNDEEARF